jgi:hypothetical protein
MLNEEPTEAGYGKAGKQKPLSNFPTASTTTKYIQLWDTDSEGKAKGRSIGERGERKRRSK